MKRNYALSVLSVLLSSVLLTGCGTARFDASAEVVKVNLPTVQQYDKETQNKAAEEMESGQCSVLSDLIVDYGVMRDETRVLLGEDVDINR